MSNILQRSVHYLKLLPPELSGPDMVVSLATITMIQARFVAAELRDNFVPALLTSQRIFPDMIARRLEIGDIFHEELAADLDALASMFRREIDAGAYIAWEADEHHIDGGYEVVCYEPSIIPIISAVNALDDLQYAVLATISAARAVRSVETLLAS